MGFIRDKHLPHPGNPKGEPNLGEREFEVGLDEQYKQAGASGTKALVDDRAKRNDRSEDYYETLRLERLAYQNKQASLDIAEREMALTERRNRESERERVQANREYTLHMANLKANDHYSVGFDRQVNLEAIEAKSNSEVLTGFDLQALRGLIVAAVAEGLSSIQK